MGGAGGLVDGGRPRRFVQGNRTRTVLARTADQTPDPRRRRSSLRPTGRRTTIGAWWGSGQTLQEAIPMSRATEPAAPHWAAWLDSMEGVPEWPQPAETPGERAARGSLLS